MPPLSFIRGKRPFLPCVGTVLLACVLGYLMGRIVAVRTALQPAPMAVRGDFRIPEPTVVVEGVQNGKVVGSMKGGVRVWIGEKQVFPDEDGYFAVEPGPFLVSDISILVPEGMQFVASKRGRKYYPILASAAQRIVPGNRVYFSSASEAEKAGYRP